jgi:hypothetical protein
MKNAVEMDSDVMIYIPSFMKIGSAIGKLIEGIHRHTDSIEIAYFHFFQNKRSRLKIQNK